MKKKLLSICLAVAMIVPCGIAFVGCGNKQTAGAAKLATKQIYAMSAVSGASYLGGTASTGCVSDTSEGIVISAADLILDRPAL
ncbi:MAG: hypothetical protein RR334_01065, partial [Clostridia bacterium]